MILDLVLPDGDGLDLCARLRDRRDAADIPVIALTGKEKLPDKLRGFAAGVDQYLVKPIDMDELVMWARALLRRVQLDKTGGKIVKSGGLELDAAAHTVRYRGLPVGNLTRREFELLYALVRSSPRLISRQEVLSQIWRTVAVENLVDVHLHNLRRKLPPEVQERVQSVPGKGFRYLWWE